MIFHSLLNILRAAVKGFLSDRVPSLAAALSFYTLLSFAPLMVLAVWVSASLGFDAQDALLRQIQDLAGNQARNVAESVMQSASERPSLGSFAGIAAILLSLIGATTVFAQLQSSLNRIWGIKAEPKNAMRGWLRRRVLSIGVIAAIGFVLIVSLGVSSFLGIVLSQSGAVWETINQVVSALILAALFGLLFRYLPDARLPWSRAWSGGLLTAILFSIGKWLIGLYLSHGDVGGAYGAAGSLMLLLVWVYYSGTIFFFGAEVVQAWAQEGGEHIPLAEHAARRRPPGQPR